MSNKKLVPLSIFDIQFQRLVRFSFFFIFVIQFQKLVRFSFFNFRYSISEDSFIFVLGFSIFNFRSLFDFRFSIFSFDIWTVTAFL